MTATSTPWNTGLRWWRRVLITALGAVAPLLLLSPSGAQRPPLPVDELDPPIHSTTITVVYHLALWPLALIVLTTAVATATGVTQIVRRTPTRHLARCPVGARS